MLFPFTQAGPKCLGKGCLEESGDVENKDWIENLLLTC